MCCYSLWKRVEKNDLDEAQGYLATKDSSTNAEIQMFNQKLLRLSGENTW